jgi:hypothetical protein
MGLPPSWGDAFGIEPCRLFMRALADSSNRLHSRLIELIHDAQLARPLWDLCFWRARCFITPLMPARYVPTDCGQAANVRLDPVQRAQDATTVRLRPRSFPGRVQAGKAHHARSLKAIISKGT